MRHTPRPRALRAIRWILLLLGVVPTALVAPYLSTIGLSIAISAIGYGDAAGWFFLVWVLCGVSGLVTLGRAALRFDPQGHGLRAWETAGICLGILACVPFAFVVYPRGIVPPRLAIVFVPLCLSATAGFFIMLVSSARKQDAGEDHQKK